MLDNNDKIKVTFLGHAFFKVEAGDLSATFDPCDEGTGYSFNENIKTNLALVSHMHHDHNNVSILDIEEVEGFNKENNVKVIKSFHDEVGGAKRGTNDIHVLNINGFKVCHLGDLGHDLTNEEIDLIGDIDILFMPVGGVYTINYEIALLLLDKIRTKIVIPMHYKTEKTTFDLETEEDFIRIARRRHQVINLNMDEISFTRKELDDIKVEEKITYVLKAK